MRKRFLWVLPPRGSGPNAKVVRFLADENCDRERRVLLTEDKDFGELVYANTEPSGGVIFIRYPAGTLTRIIHGTSAAIADPLLRQACGQRARPSDPQRTARVRIGSSRLRAPVSQRGSAISPRTVMNNAG